MIDHWYVESFKTQGLSARNRRSTSGWFMYCLKDQDLHFLHMNHLETRCMLQEYEEFTYGNHYLYMTIGNQWPPK